MKKAKETKKDPFAGYAQIPHKCVVCGAGTDDVMTYHTDIEWPGNDGKNFMSYHVCNRTVCHEKFLKVAAPTAGEWR